MSKIVHSAQGATILGAGTALNHQLTQAREFAPFLVAADGGAEMALANGVLPDAVIGDMDSLATLKDTIPAARIHHIPEQETTDFEKCLYSLSIPFAIAIGVTGDRVDHSFASLNALTKYRSYPVVVISGRDLIFLAPRNLRLNLPVGTRLSLCPMGAVRAKSTGLEYPVDGIDFAPDGRIGTSNRVTEQQVALEFDQDNMLVMLPDNFLRPVLTSLTGLDF